MAKCVCGHKKKKHIVDGCLHYSENPGELFCHCLEYRPAKKVREWNFDFCIAGLTEEQAKSLLDRIIDYAEIYGAQVGGGYQEANHEQD